MEDGAEKPVGTDSKGSVRGTRMNIRTGPRVVGHTRRHTRRGTSDVTPRATGTKEISVKENNFRCSLTTESDSSTIEFGSCS